MAEVPPEAKIACATNTNSASVHSGRIRITGGCVTASGVGGATVVNGYTPGTRCTGRSRSSMPEEGTWGA